MKTCCSIRSLCPERSESDRSASGTAPPGPAIDALRALVAAPVLIAAVAALLTGCSDDVVCTEHTTPYVVARVEEVGAARAGSTAVEVYCSSDPRMSPGQLNVSIAERQLSGPFEAQDQAGFVMTLSDTQVVWQPGTSCMLEVTTEFGVASSQEVVPGTFEVTAPDTSTLGELLTLSWTESMNADYYRIQATLDGAQGETPLDIAVDGTSVSFDETEVTSAGVFSGRIWAVSGRFPQSGAAGNVAGEGWGYYSIAYRDAAGEFEVVVLDSTDAH